MLTSTKKSVSTKPAGAAAHADMPQRWAREKFIPVRAADLIQRLTADATLTIAQREHFQQLCRLLMATFHYEYHGKLNELKDLYARFDPDADTLLPEGLAPAEQQRQADALFERLGWLLERANFERLTPGDIKQALNAASDWGLQLSVNLDMFDRLEVYARGDVMSRKTRRHWRQFYRPKVVEAPMFQRLVVAFQLHSYHTIDGHLDGDRIHLKIFKNIPKMDLEMLLPGSRVKMSLVDRSKILLPTVSGVAMTGWKLFQGAVVVAVTGFYGMLTYLGLIAATLGYGVKSFFGYLRTQQKYQLNLTRSLYYQNLDNNAGVLFRLLDEAEEQECREAILAYFFLWHTAQEAWSSARLDAEIEAFLATVTRASVDFEVADAVAKLKRLGLVEGDELMRAAPIEVALERLDRTWDNLFSYCRDRQAEAAPSVPQPHIAWPPAAKAETIAP